MSAELRSLRKLERQIRRIMRGQDRAALAEKAQVLRGCRAPVWITNAQALDILATLARLEALRHPIHQDPAP